MGDRQRLRTALAAAGLVLLVAVVYGPVAGHDFINYDDQEYVYQNPAVLNGISADGIRWAFTTGHAANWHPLTWISHMADVSLFGTGPGAHHVVNVVFHALNAVLLVLALQGLTGSLWRSAAVAALFAVHPLNVQSVAWVAERKNVLSTFFWLLALLAYARYARQPSRKKMAVVALVLTLGLMSKPMLVSLPLVLLVLDFWPLRRIVSPADGGWRSVWGELKPLVLEKAPLFVLIFVSSAVTWLVQARGAATASVNHYPLVDRIANAALSYVRYLLDAAWPSSLAVFNPHPRNIGEPVAYGMAVAAATALAVASYFVVSRARRFPYLVAGWAWYAITLVPVIGIVQVGAQSRADRYTYVPMIGIFVAVVWGGAEVFERLRSGVLVATMVVCLVVGTLAVRARREVGYWKDGGTLYTRAIHLNERNWLAWNNLGTYRLDRKEIAEALACFDAAARNHKDFADAHYNRGVALQNLGRPGEAIAAFRRTLEIDPKNADGWVNLGNAFSAVGRPQEAVPAYANALRIRPDDAYALNGLVLAYDTLGDRRRAFEALARLREVDPGMAEELFVPPAPR